MKGEREREEGKRNDFNSDKWERGGGRGGLNCSLFLSLLLQAKEGSRKASEHFRAGGPNLALTSLVCVTHSLKANS